MKFRLVILSALAALLLSACVSLAEDITPPPAYKSPTPRPTVGPLYPGASPDLENGAAIYAEKCAACHGETGLGDGPQAAQLPNPPAALADPATVRQASPAQWFTTVTQGDLDNFMPPFSGLSEQDRWDVVAYAFSMSVTPEQLAAGEELFTDNCIACHGPDGTGIGGAADFTDQAFMADFSAAEMYEAISNGTMGGMPTFGATLDEGGRWALTAYLRTFTLGAMSAPAAAPEPSQTPEPAAGTPTDESALSATPLAEGETTPAATGQPATEVAAEPTATPDGLGTISGVVTNGSGGELPSGLEITLRGFDINEGGGFTESITLSTELDADGSYTFNDVPMPAQRAFVAVIDYQTVIYASDPAFVAEGTNAIDLPVTFFETSTDASALSVDRWHIFIDYIDPKADTVQIVEVFVVTNPTVKTIVPAEEGQAVITFSLPEGATNLQFDDSTIGDRYVQTMDGFGDKAPVLPGIGQHQIVVAFEIPYSKKMDFAQPVSLPVDSAIVMVPQGIKLRSDLLQEGGTRDFQGTVYDLYASQPLPVGATLEMTISGKPKAAASPTSDVDSRRNMLIGAGALGIVLILTGLWLFWRDRSQEKLDEEFEDEEYDLEEAEDEVEFDDAESVMDAIIALDDAYRAGDLPEEAYKQRRAELRARLKELV
ncbi:MAG: c-type cytochrome [Chloroflexi bacterium]|nr:c-type cytochrome [Chloroflexota bacterium]